MLAQQPVLIVIPTFNRADRLERSIRSVFNQSSSGYSLVIVDDASTTDQSGCRDLVLEAGHHWLTLDRNQGPAAARNFGTKNRSFEWVMFLDSDDGWLPDKLEFQMNWHAGNPEIRISQVGEKWLRNGALFTKPKHLAQPDGEVFSECVSRCAISPSCVAIRRDLWEETGGFDPWFRVCEDYELWLRIASRERVGLVSGDAMVEKHGGHSDQLSTSVPALDGYRFVALAMFLNRDPTLPEEYRKTVVEALEKKAQILAKGAARRKRSEWEAFFGQVEIPLLEESVLRAREYCASLGV